MEAGAPTFVLCMKNRQRWWPWQTLVLNGAIPARSHAQLSVCIGFLTQRDSHGVKNNLHKGDAVLRKGNGPFSAYPDLSRSSCQGAGEKMLLETTAAGPGTVPLCTLSPQASSTGSEGGCPLLCTKPAGRVQLPCHHCLRFFCHSQPSELGR